jgi:hypothetical protein
MKDGAPQGSLSPPTNSQARRRRRSADDRLGSLTSTSDEPYRSRRTSSRTALKYAISETSINDGGDGDDDRNSDSECDSQSPIATLHTPKRLEFPSSSLTESERAPLLQTPTTPINRNRKPIIHAATDPGGCRKSKVEGSTLTPTSRPHRYWSPCGLKSYVRPGACLEKHKFNCEHCRTQLLEELREKQAAEEYSIERARTEQVEREKMRIVTHRVDEAKEAEQKRIARKSIRPQTDEGRDYVSAKDIDVDLIKQICKELTLKEKDGWVYLVRNPDRKGYFKIGYTQDLTKRKQAIEMKCGIQLRTADVWGKMKCVKRIEALAQLDLLHLRQKWNCAKCGDTHGEWFRVDEDLAIATVDKWVTWMQREPYNKNGTVKSVWSELIAKMRRPEPRFANEDHEARFAHWEKALQPPTEEELERIEEPESKTVPGGQLVQQRDAGTDLLNKLQSMKLEDTTVRHININIKEGILTTVILLLAKFLFGSDSTRS